MGINLCKQDTSDSVLSLRHVRRTWLFFHPLILPGLAFLNDRYEITIEEEGLSFNPKTPITFSVHYSLISNPAFRRISHILLSQMWSLDSFMVLIWVSQIYLRWGLSVTRCLLCIILPIRFPRESRIRIRQHPYSRQISGRVR